MLSLRQCRLWLSASSGTGKTSRRMSSLTHLCWSGPMKVLAYLPPRPDLMLIPLSCHLPSHLSTAPPSLLVLFFSFFFLPPLLPSLPNTLVFFFSANFLLCLLFCLLGRIILISTKFKIWFSVIFLVFLFKMRFCVALGRRRWGFFHCLLNSLKVLFWMLTYPRSCIPWACSHWHCRTQSSRVSLWRC